MEPLKIFKAIMKHLCDDNSFDFQWTEGQAIKACVAIERLLKSGYFQGDLYLRDESNDCYLLGGGEIGEVEERFAKDFENYTILSDILNDIFNEDGHDEVY